MFCLLHDENEFSFSKVNIRFVSKTIVSTFYLDGALLAGVPSFATTNTRVGCIQGNERSHQTLLRCVPNSAQTQLQGTKL